LIVLDASLVIAWLLTEDLPVTGSGFYESLPSHPLLVPSHWPLEVSNVLRTQMRAGRLSVADLHTIMDRFDLLSIQIEPPFNLDEIGPLAAFAVANELTTYDASYVQLALRLHAPLATLDRAMRRAAVALDIALLPAA
jgi:predicted nucleic acid-binding protein